MKHLKLTWILLLGCLLSPLIADDDDDDRFLFNDLSFRRVELPSYQFENLTPHVKLEMAYAEHEVKNPQDWRRIAHSVVPYEIDLVFTLYPKNLAQWRTNYFDLLNERMKTLFALDSALNSPDIHWNMVLQTEPQTEESAKSFFHGFVIKYRPKQARLINEVRSASELRDLISGTAAIRDSTVYRVLERHPEWNNMLVVMDWTGSMYKHGAQLVHWYKVKRFERDDIVKHFVFFNDGNHKRSYQKRIGRTGGVYRAKSVDIEEILNTMEYVMSKGNGGDPPENDIEALLTGIQYLEGYQSVVLIADNKSEVRDIDLLSKIKLPIHIILCDAKGYVHPHYQKLAKATGGSIHTIEQDLSASQN